MKFRVFFPRLPQFGGRGTAAVEFAIIVPMLLILMLGTAEILLLYRTEAKLNELTANVAQMVSLQNLSVQSPITGITTGTTGTLGDICTGAGWGLQPLPPNGLTIAVASVTQNGTAKGAPTYDIWEADRSCNKSATAIGTTAACALVNAGKANSMLINQDDNVIIARATLTYPGIVGLILGAAPTLTQTAFSRWRYASTLATPTELTCATGTDCTVNNGFMCP